MAIRVELELASGDFTTRMIHAGETVQQFQRNVGQAYTSLNRVTESSASFLTTLRDVTITLGMAREAVNLVRDVTMGWAADIIKVNAEMERLQFLLKGMSTAADPVREAANQVKYLRDFAKQAPFALSAISDTFVKMKATGLDPMNGSLKSLADGIAAFGGTDETLKRATIAITQMSGKGVIQMEELRQQLGEAIPRAVELMARSMGLTTGQLISTISKGTLESKSALNAFFLEMDRTFGGAAQEQMQSFNGMLSRTRTLIQDLALKAGEAGFFDAVKTQLKDFNTMLTGPVASDFAVKLGQVLGDFVGYIRQGIEWIFRMRNEIIMVGEAAAIAFGSRLAINGLMSIIGGLSGMRAELALGRAQLASFRAGMTGIVGMASGVRSVSDAITALGLAGGALARILPLLGTGLMFVSTYALPLILIVGGLAAAFGLLSNETKDAYENMTKFGFESQEQLEKSRRYVEEQVRLLDDLKRAKENASGADLNTGYYMGVDDSMISAKEAEVAKMQKAQAEGEVEFQKRRAQKLYSARLEEIEDRVAAVRKGYDQEARDAAKAHDDAIKALQNEGKDTSQKIKDFQASRRQQAIEFYESQLQILTDYQEKAKAKRESGNADEIAIGEKLEQELIKRQRQLQETIARTREMSFAPNELAKGDNLGKLLERAKKRLDDVNSTIAEQRAEIAGVSGEYAKLAYMIQDAASKRFGPIDNEEVRKVTDELLRQQKVLDELEAKARGKKKFASDIERITQDLQNEILELSTKGKSRLDKFNTAVSMGLYSGLTPIQRMQQGFKGMGTDARAAAEGMDAAFGDAMQRKGLNMIEVVKTATGVWSGFKAAVNGTFDGIPDIGEAIKGPPKPHVGPYGQSVYSGNSYLSNLFGAEASNNPNARATTSSALGLGQFIEGTWMDFLKQMHPEMMNAGRQALLDLRKDPGMMIEASAWYARQNADRLEESGVDLNDANLYLAHFLGPGGAVAALTKSTDTLLASIPQLNAARAANPRPFNDLVTVGDLKAWAEAKFGTRLTAPLNKNDSFEIGAAVRNAPDDKSRETVFAAQALETYKNQLKVKTDLAEAEKRLAAEAAKSEDNVDGLNKQLAKTKAEIRAGMYGRSLDPEAKQYERLIQLAIAADKAENTRQERKRLGSKLTALQESQAREKEILAEKTADIKRQFESGQKFRFSNQYYSALARAQRNQELADKGLAIGSNGMTEADRARIIETDKQMTDTMRDNEIAAALLVENEKVKTIERGLMTADQAREATFQDEVARLQNMLSLTTTNAELRAQIEDVLQRKIRAYRAKTLAEAPMAKMAREWSDISNNLQKSATGWLDGATDKLADFVTTGKADFKSLADSIIKDMARIAIRGAAGNLLGIMKGTPVAMGGGAAKGGLGKAVAQHHRGGIAGTIAPTRLIDPMVFSGARKFHTGSLERTIGGDEIPIIAKKGEWIGWPEQAAAQFGGRSSVIAPSINVTVQGSAGASPAEHAKMGEAIANAANDHIKKMVSDELRTRQRPGGVDFNRSRR